MIDIIIPVYKGLQQTRRCIESVLENPQRAPFEIVVVDDLSPDPKIASHLCELAARGQITLLRNETNLGFVHSANRGMSLHPDRDLVLLNSDTEVANDWLDRLRRCAYRQPDIGTVTPFSNNATICSYPFYGWADGIPGTLGLAALDRLIATTNADQMVDLPTAVGFCMYIRRACLDQSGLFDVENFGRGYGEENDFCMRAAKAGWRSVLAADLFIFHEGSVSFSHERSALVEIGEKTLREIHPDYSPKVHEFVIRDPVSELRQAVDSARVTHGADEGRYVVAERADERSRLMARLWEVEDIAEDRDAAVRKLNRGLSVAETAVAERDAEIAELRVRLGHCESLAFEQARELDRIHKTWIWRCMTFFARKDS